MTRKVVFKSALLLLFILPLFLKSCEKPTRYCVECDCLTLEKCYSSQDRAQNFAELMEIGGTCDCSIYED